MLAPGTSAGSHLLGHVNVNRIGFGTKRLGRDPVALLRRAVELGVNHIDTAAFYPTAGDESLGWANETVREALSPYPDDLLIATKVGPAENQEGLARPEELRGHVEANLRGLGVERLDLVYLRPYGLDSIAEHFAALAELRDEGLIRHLGVSNVRVPHLAQAQAIAPVVAVQNRYGIDFGRVNDEMIDLCGAQGIAFVPFFALAGTGREAGGVAVHDAVDAFAREHGVTPAQVRIAWTLSRGPHVLAIPGTSSVEHLTENLRAGDLIGLPGLAAL